MFSLKNKNSADGLTADVLKISYKKISDALLHMINSSVALKKVPELLKISKIITNKKVNNARKAISVSTY